MIEKILKTLIKFEILSIVLYQLNYTPTGSTTAIKDLKACARSLRKNVVELVREGEKARKIFDSSLIFRREHKEKYFLSLKSLSIVAVNLKRFQLSDV